MIEQEPAAAQAEVAIDADPEAVYALITDLPTLASLAEEASGSRSRIGATTSPPLTVAVE